MSANLDYSTGRAGMAYAGEMPWHRDGTQLDPGADLITWRKTAGLDWSVQREPVFVHVGGHDDEDDSQPHRQIALPRHRALVRSDNENVLSVVSDRYVPHQPQEVVEFFSDLISDHGFCMHTMGSLAGGKQIWALAETGDDFRLLGQDLMSNYLLLATSYDGTAATTAMLTNVRVVCQNTFSMALQQSERGAGGVRAHHRAGLDERALKQQLGVFELTSEDFKRQADEMARMELSKDALAEYIDRVFKVDREELGEDPLPYPVRRCVDLVTDGPGADLRSARNTLWGGFNAITRYQDHESPNRGGNRFRAATFGAGANRKHRAWDVARDMLEAA